MKTQITKIGAHTLATAVVLAINLCRSGQSAQPVLESPIMRSDDHQTTYLRWSADSGGVYQVESADRLATQGMQGLTWVIRETDCAARGTSAQWVDFGDVRWIPRVFHPIFQPQRFYRVRQIKQATLTAPNVSVQVLQGGSPLPVGTNAVSGNVFVAVNVTLVDTNQQLASVKVFVDGQQTHSVPSYGSTNYVNTTQWPNGIHEIYAVATTIDYSETIPDSDSATATNAAHLGIGVSASKFLVFSNFISQFFIGTPSFEAGQTQQVLAKFEADANWRLRIVNYQEVTVRQLTGQGTSLYATWDGRNDSGSPLPYGFYDYIIEARPSQYGPLGAAGGGGFAAASWDPDPTSEFRQTPNALQFTADTNAVTEGLAIPSLNSPANSGAGAGGGSPPSPTANANTTSAEQEQPVLFPNSVRETLANGFTSFFVPHWPMPPVRVNGKWVPYEEVYGPLPPIEIPISDATIERYAKGKLTAFANGAENGESTAAWPDAVYSTRTPLRAAGSLFFGFAGTVGVGFQGHHPKPEPYFPLPSGGVISLSRPPYGPLANASTIGNGFANDMGSAGWRTSFLLGNDTFRSIDLASAAGPGSGTSRFARNCNFGFIVGHMTASQREDADFGYASVGYFPFFDSTLPLARYNWIGLPGMDLGDGSIFSKLRWMALYGCNSLREADADDMWTKFVLPMPPNLRLLLGAEDGVFIHPLFGSRFANDMNGNSPMTIWAAWRDAAQAADVETAKQLRYKVMGLGTRRMTVVFRATTQGGTWNTINDSIWNWGSDISYDWFDVTFNQATVYPP